MEYKEHNVETFRKLCELAKEDFEAVKQLIDEQDPENREEVLQMWKRVYHCLKGVHLDP
ncbi:hypothetical protein OAC78_06480 [Litorivicinus sp.]|nr:hypothetical protein [Litorivicinus sp.]MDC1466193.1 hypothetical protein [Litorivicinus sp.]